MKKSLLLALLAAAVGTSAQAQTLTLVSPTINDGSFESAPTTSQNLFMPSTSSTAVIPYWGFASAAATPAATAAVNSGVTQGNVTEAGTNGAFLQPGGAAFNLVTARAIVAGDMYTLTFFGRDTNAAAGTGAADPITASLFSQTVPTGATYMYAPVATLASITPTLTFVTGTAANNNGFTQYSFTYTATAADAGKDIGMVVTNNGADFNGLDNFALTVTPGAVPEPSTYAMLAVGGLGAMLVLRRRRA